MGVYCLLSGGVCHEHELDRSRLTLRTIDQVVELLRPDQRLLFITGARLSADSGLPTYRGVGGLYGTDSITRHGYSIEQVLSGWMIRRAAGGDLGVSLRVGADLPGAKPNRAHQVIAAMEDAFDAVWTLTQNVDGFHRRAGSRHLIEIHGNLHCLICTRCDFREEVEDFVDLDVPPLCPRCDANVRPDVVLFGEELPAAKLALLELADASGI